MALTFKKLARVNFKRAQRWHKSKNLDDWSISDWATAAAGEMGEVCNAIKKLRRVECHFANKNEPKRQIRSREKAMKEIGKEIADTIMYLNLLAIRCGLSLENEVIKKFNETSKKYGFPERL